MRTPLTYEMRKRIEAMLAATTSLWEQRRLRVILMLGSGVAPREIVARLKCNRATLYRWWQTWEASGLDGLLKKPQVGRRRYITAEVELMVEAWLASDPITSGFSGRAWTVPLLCNALDNAGIPIYDDRVLRRAIKRRGWRYIGGRWRHRDE